MKKKKLIIGLVGQIASGKGTIANYLEKKYHASVYRFSDIMRDVLIRLHVELDRKNLQQISTVIRENFGEDVFAKIIAENVVQDDNKIIVVDGIRRMADIKYLNKNKSFKLVKVLAETEIRYNRQLARDEKTDDKGKSFADFKADQEREADAEIPQVMEKALSSIDNNGSFKNLFMQINNLLYE